MKIKINKMKARTVNESINREESKRVSSIGTSDKILQFIEDAGPEGRRYSDIIKLAYELKYGPGTYSREHRGHWSGAFKTPTPDDRGFGHLIKYITKNDKGNWILRKQKMSPEEEAKVSNSARYGSSTIGPKVLPGGKFNV